MYQDIETMCFKMGIRTYSDTYFTMLDGGSPTKIGQDMPNPIGWIYGISIETDSVYPTDATKPTITIDQASKLYLYFKEGTDLYLNNFRCDRAVFSNPPAPLPTTEYYSNPKRYFQINIPKMTDLKQSYYNNPTAIKNVYVPLTIYYIDILSYNELLHKGYLHAGVRSMPAKHTHK
jgi:hypothetical protein